MSDYFKDVQLATRVAVLVISITILALCAIAHLIVTVLGLTQYETVTGIAVLTFACASIIIMILTVKSYREAKRLAELEKMTLQ